MSNNKKEGKKKKAVAVVDGDDLEPANTGRALTDMQAAFVAAFVSGPETGGKPTQAAIAAGYSEKTATQIARELLGKPHISAAIDEALRTAIGTELTVEAVAMVRSIMRNEEASLKLRGEMAVRIIEFSGLVERTKAQKAKDTGLGGGKTLAECSRDELEDIVRKGAAVLQAAAGLPPSGPVIEGVSAQDNAQRPALASE